MLWRRQRPPSDEVGLRMRRSQAASCGSGGHVSLAASDGKGTGHTIQHKWPCCCCRHSIRSPIQSPATCSSHYSPPQSCSTGSATSAPLAVVRAQVAHYSTNGLAAATFTIAGHQFSLPPPVAATSHHHNPAMLQYQRYSTSREPAQLQYE